jgi:hypothetical protein
MGTALTFCIVSFSVLSLAYELKHYWNFNLRNT